MQGRKQLAYWLMALVLIAANVTLAQEQDENDPAKALALVRAAIKARGGDAYLKVRQTITRGQYTAYEKGVSGNPSAFVDYIAPGRERTEFGKSDYKYVQANSDTANWIYDAKSKAIKDQTDEQVKNFKQGARYDLDNLLRAANSQQGVKLIYLGRRLLDLSQGPNKLSWKAQVADGEIQDGALGTGPIVGVDRYLHLTH